MFRPLQSRARKKYLMVCDVFNSVLFYGCFYFVFVFVFISASASISVTVSAFVFVVVVVVFVGFRDYHDMSVVSTAIDPHNVAVRNLVVTDFTFSRQTGTFDLNITWLKPSFNYSQMSSYKLSYQVNGGNKIMTKTVGV